MSETLTPSTDPTTDPAEPQPESHSPGVVAVERLLAGLDPAARTALESQAAGLLASGTFALRPLSDGRWLTGSPDGRWMGGRDQGYLCVCRGARAGDGLCVHRLMVAAVMAPWIAAESALYRAASAWRPGPTAEARAPQKFPKTPVAGVRHLQTTGAGFTHISEGHGSWVVTHPALRVDHLRSLCAAPGRGWDRAQAFLHPAAQGDAECRESVAQGFLNPFEHISGHLLRQLGVAMSAPERQGLIVRAAEADANRVIELMRVPVFAAEVPALPRDVQIRLLQLDSREARLGVSRQLRR